MATRLISATQENPEHYLTVLRSPTKDDQDLDPAAKSNLERFLWNFLALRTSVGPGSSQQSGTKLQWAFSTEQRYHWTSIPQAVHHDPTTNSICLMPLP